MPVRPLFVPLLCLTALSPGLAYEPESEPAPTEMDMPLGATPSAAAPDSPGSMNPAGRRTETPEDTTLPPADPSAAGSSEPEAGAAEREPVRGRMIEEVIVTAQKRAQRLQDVPISVAALGGEKIESVAAMQLEQLNGYLPNVTITDEQVSTRVTIRGIGSGGNPGFDQSVGLFSDGIYLARGPQFRSGFLDVDQIEVLRGPQATLFGRNTIAGAINLTSRKPTKELEIELRQRYETQYGESEFTSVVSGPITDDLRGRFAFQHGNSPGYVRNLALNRDEAQRDTDNYRGTLIWDATSRLTLTAQYEAYALEQIGREMTIIHDELLSVVDGQVVITPTCRFRGQCGLQYVNNVSNDRGEPGFDRDEFSDVKTELGVFTASYDLGGYDLKAITGWASSSLTELNDGNRQPAAQTLASNAQTERFRQISQELRIVSPTGGAIDWIAGVYFEHGELDYDENISLSNALFGNTLPGNLWIATRFSQESDAAAAFAQGTWHILPNLHLTGGLRFSNERKKATQDYPLLIAGTDTRLADALVAAGQSRDSAEAAAAGIGNAFNFDEHAVADSRDKSHVSPLLTLQWEPSDGTMLYGTAAIGYKSGGFDARLASSANDFEFDDEKATTFEVGSKSLLFGGSAEINIALFHTQYENLQFSAYNGGLSFFVDNAADADVMGVEVDGRWRATDRLTLNGALAVTDFEFKNFSNGPCDIYQQVLANAAAGSTSAACTVDRSGDTAQNVPKLSGVFGAEWRQAAGRSMQMVISADAIYEGSFFAQADLDERLKQEAYWKFNARLGFTSNNDRWSLALLGRNLSNETTFHWGNDVPLTAGARSARLDPPRTFLIEARLRY